MKKDKIDLTDAFAKKEVMRHVLNTLDEHPDELRGFMTRIKLREDTVTYIFAVTIKRRHDLKRVLREDNTHPLAERVE